MKSKLQTLLFGLALLSTLNPQPSTFAQGTAFTYQGQLEHLGGPANGNYDLTFSVWDSPVGPAQVSGALTNLNVTLSNGLVTATLDFGAGVFTGAARWLEIGVRTNGGSAFTLLVPRHPITAAPYAMVAGNITGVLPLGALSGTYTGAVAFSNSANVFNGAHAGNGANVTNLSAANLSSGTLADARLSANVALLNTPQTFTADKSFNAGSQLFADSGSAVAPGLSFNGDPNNGIFRPAADSLAFATVGVEQMRIDAAGDLGIGVTNPIFAVHAGTSLGTNSINFAGQRAVIENATTSGRAAFLALAGVGPPSSTNRVEAEFEASDVEHRVIIGSASAHEVQFRQNNLARLTLSTNGNVGINTNSPQHRLDVAGSVRIQVGPTTVTVNTDGSVSILSSTNITFTTTGDINLNGRDVTLNASRNLNTSSGTSTAISSSGPMSVHATGALDLQGSLINLN